MIVRWFNFVESTGLEVEQQVTFLIYGCDRVFLAGAFFYSNLFTRLVFVKFIMWKYLETVIL